MKKILLIGAVLTMGVVVFLKIRKMKQKNKKLRNETDDLFFMKQIRAATGQPPKFLKDLLPILRGERTQKRVLH